MVERLEILTLSILIKLKAKRCGLWSQTVYILFSLNGMYRKFVGKGFTWNIFYLFIISKIIENYHYLKIINYIYKQLPLCDFTQCASVFLILKIRKYAMQIFGFYYLYSSIKLQFLPLLLYRYTILSMIILLSIFWFMR